MHRVSPAVVTLTALLSMVAVAEAQRTYPLVAEGRARFEQADLVGALRALARAEQADDMSREQLIELYELRILVLYTRGDRHGVDRDLESLASIEPHHELGPEIPPEVRSRFQRHARDRRGPIAMRVRGETGDGRAVLAPKVENDPAGLVRAARIHARVQGESFRTSINEPLELDVPGGGTVEYYAEAIGPGGAVVARSGSRDAPRRLSVGEDGGGGPAGEPDPILGDLGGGGYVGDDEGGTHADDQDDGDGPGPWLYVGIGAGALAAVAIIVTVVAVSGGGGGGDGTVQPGFPMVDF